MDGDVSLNVLDVCVGLVECQIERSGQSVQY